MKACGPCEGILSISEEQREAVTILLKQEGLGVGVDEMIRFII